MKKLGLIIVMCLVWLTGTQSCMAQAKIFKDAAEIDGVTSIYISPMLLKLGGASTIGHGLDDAVSDLKAVEIITADGLSQTKMKSVMNACRKVIDKLGCELLMAVNDDDDKVMIYAAVDEGSKYAKELVVEVDEEGHEYTVIYIKGKIDLEKISQDDLF